MVPFPESAPYRIDQVTAAPLGLMLLSLAALITAAAISLSARAGRGRIWWALNLLLLALVTLLFGLASWGTSDVTKLSHFLAFESSRIRGEAFWTLTAPLIVQLPYRMAMVHGLVVAGYAAMPMLLARRWAAGAWAGWWALLVVFSPLLRNFLQNGVSRQALMTLLLIPMLLWAGHLTTVGRGWLAVTTAWAVSVHTSFLGTLVLALMPRALVPGVPTLRNSPSPAEGRGRRLLLRTTLLSVLLLLLAVALPVAWEKLSAYTLRESFFNRYALALPVARLQLAMTVGVTLVCWRRRLGWRELLGCNHTSPLMGFGLLFLLIQECLRHGWLPPLTSRFADSIGLFLLVIWLAWMQHYRAHWAVLPALLVTLDYWLLERMPDAITVACGRDDTFLCLPDRWPWQVRWPPVP